ncbi:MAG: hypothetical protein QM655_16895 [Nocardioidaceae bacterium]
MARRQRKPDQDVPDYTRLPEPVRLEDTVASVSASVPFFPTDAQMEELRLPTRA